MSWRVTFLWAWMGDSAVAMAMGVSEGWDSEERGSEAWGCEGWRSEVWRSEEWDVEGGLENEITKRRFKRTLKSVNVVETIKGVR